jgi:hypothetical protein
MNGERFLNKTVNTDGKGLWSRRRGPVTITKIVWTTSPPNEYRDEPETLLRVFLDPRTWDNSVHGLVYTDGTFRKELRDLLVELHAIGELPDLPWSELNYTEQGMQGGCYRACTEGCTEHPPSVHMILGRW